MKTWQTGTEIRKAIGLNKPTLQKLADSGIIRRDIRGRFVLFYMPDLVEWFTK